MKTRSLALTPLDNTRLANLCGSLDENLRQIETAFDITISRRSEHLSLHGNPVQTQRAAQALKRFYADADSPLDVGQIQLALIELKNLDAADQPVTQLLTPRNDSPLEDGWTPLSKEQPTRSASAPRRAVHGRTPRQIEYIRHIQNHDITFGIGPAGTGKTYLAVACAVDAFERQQVDRIVLTRPAVEAGERLGFLPGDLAQKVDPYLRPLYDALYDLMGYDRVAKLFERQCIEIAPLAFMRGRTLNKAFIILDEAQNTTPEQMKMFLTRIGIGARAVVTGDPTQIDLPRGHKSGLVDAIHTLVGVRGIASTHFLKDDVVRHPLVARIVEAYERATTSKNVENTNTSESKSA